MPSPKTLDSWVILAVIMDNALNRKEIPLSELLNAPCNVGKVFNLDAISLIDVLNEAEKTGIIKIIRTAGLDVIQINGKYSFIDCVHNFYKSVNEKI